MGAFRNACQSSESSDIMEKIKGMLKSDGTARLKEVPVSWLRYTTVDQAIEIETKVFSNAIRLVENHFGLRVQITTVDRSASELEKLEGVRERIRRKALLKDTKKQTESQLERIAELRGRRNELLGAGLDNEEDLEELRELDNQIKRGGAGTGAARGRSKCRDGELAPPKATEFSFDRFLAIGTDESKKLEDRSDDAAQDS